MTDIARVAEAVKTSVASMQVTPCSHLVFVLKVVHACAVAMHSHNDCID